MINDDLKKKYIQIAQFYYEQNLTQNEIAQKTGINRTSISRILKKIRDEGIVKITINYDLNDLSLAEKLEKQFHLKKAIVIPVDPGQPAYVKRTAIGQAASKFLDSILEDNDVIGLSWGSTLATAVEALDPTELHENIFCVPMVGGPAGKLESRYHVNTICFQAAEKLKARSLMIDVPAVVEKPSMKKDWMQTHYYKEVSNMWRNITIAVVGIGSINSTGHSTWRAFYSDSSVDQFKEEHVVGDICSRFFDHYGNEIQTHLADRTLSIPLELLHNTRYTIGVAESAEKIPGILGALNGGHLNVLVTTDETADGLLALTEQK
ncbi:sugar-binding transcriptional regulator [Sporolactobacillus nakayamae]|uniref:DNA-binding transcriptional regulator LsrR, DeoR family n=1 Tax=Sporolactobacillus nakayamae TaxID=269670 RepID=A0A1I2ST17_9BACL|nr:sugar-binding transcriptional regulator [Sporolactobacillus nakayamae]SFG55974.1 DNA-binding transcriptional regulator LsrR, DeoR family [Sporolactobacillus nakayamae]